MITTRKEEAAAAKTEFDSKIMSSAQPTISLVLSSDVCLHPSVYL